MFAGDVVNVSGWVDIDKEGSHYKDYFSNAKSYTVTNYKSEFCGYQGLSNEIFLNLEEELPDELINRFDVVFNHTVLEHIFEIEKAFKNLCLLSKDVVILVVPFLQQMHTNYGDYFRFSPLSIERMFVKNNMQLLYLNFNSHKNSSVYIFAIATKHPENWKNSIPTVIKNIESKKPDDNFDAYIGCHAIQNRLFSLMLRIKKIFKMQLIN
ncbi:MAG: hypothetical protein V1874_12245 [Spirochaetota bacterium]